MKWEAVEFNVLKNENCDASLNATLICVKYFFFALSTVRVVIKTLVDEDGHQ